MTAHNHKGRFYVHEEIDDFGDFIVEVGDTKTRKGPCVNIVVDKSQKYGMIQNALYRPTSLRDYKIFGPPLDEFHEHSNDCFTLYHYINDHCSVTFNVYKYV